jgi:hypothetical protein
MLAIIRCTSLVFQFTILNIKVKLYSTIFLSVFLYGCETVTHTEGGTRLRVFENRVLRRIFGPKSDEETWEWRRLHKEELYAQYSSPNIIRVVE